MRTAIISDIHGNLEALIAVIKDADQNKIDLMHCLGDVVGYGADPKACLDLVSRKCDVKLMGNHEYTALGLQSTEYYNEAAKAAIEWTLTQLTDVDLATMADFEMERNMDGFCMVHASPFEPDRWHYVLTAQEAALAFQHMSARLCFCGHSHIPMVISQAKDSAPRIRAGHTFLPDEELQYLINVGSVGQPRDKDPRSAYVIYDDDEQEIELRRVEYDISKAQGKMTRATLPDVLINRLAVGI